MLALHPFSAGMQSGRWSPLFFLMNTKELLEKIEVLTAPILENLGFELIEREFVAEHGRWILRLYIERTWEEGAAQTPVSIADCETASRAVSAMMDVENPVSGSYFLEVSSPGLDRPLRRKKDFERFKECLISLKTQYPIDGRHTFTAVRLRELKGENIIVQDGDKEWVIPMEAIKKAKLKPA